MKLRLKLGIVLVCLTFSLGCSFPWIEVVAPVANFAIGFYDHDDYYSKECLWYDEVKLNEETKKWFMENNPPEVVSKDLSKVSSRCYHLHPRKTTSHRERQAYQHAP